MLDLASLLSFHNPWWLTGAVPEALNPPFQRPVLARLLSYLEQDKLVLVKGPRRTGKTTLLFQMIAELLQRGVEPQRLLYLPLDDPDLESGLSAILFEFEKLLGRELSSGPHVYCFFDEVQYFENWSSHLKKYVDKKWPITFVASGSSASLIRHGAESLAGRTIEEVVLPFAFSEFALFYFSPEERALLERLRSSFQLTQAEFPGQSAVVARKCAILFERYLTCGGFPEAFLQEDPRLRKKLLVESLIEKVIYRDLVSRYGVKRPDRLEKLFLYLANHSSDILNITSVSNSLKLSRDVVQSYITYLSESYLVMLTPRFASSAEKRIRANPKVHVPDPGFLEAFTDLPTGKRVESVVARHLFSQPRAYYHNKHEVDFVLQIGGRTVPIEVKFRENIRNSDLAGFHALNRASPFEHGWLLTKTELGRQDEVTLVPASLFLALI